MPNFKTVRQLSDRTGVSISTIRAMLRNDGVTFITTPHRPIRIDVDFLPEEFTCLYDPVCILLDKFLATHNMDSLEFHIIRKHIGYELLKSPKQTNGYWCYVNLISLWEAFQNVNDLSELPKSLLSFAKGEKPIRQANEETYLQKRSLTIVFTDERARRAWVEDHLGEVIIHDDPNVILLHQTMTAQVQSVNS